MAAFANNVSFFAVDLRQIALNRKQMGRDLLHKTMELVGEGNLHCPRPLNLFPVSDVEGAFRYLQSGKNTGRIIIQIDPSAKVQVCLLDLKYRPRLTSLETRPPPSVVAIRRERQLRRCRRIGWHREIHTQMDGL